MVHMFYRPTLLYRRHDFLNKKDSFCLLWLHRLQLLCKKGLFRQEQRLVKDAGNGTISHSEPQRLAQSAIQAFAGRGLEDGIILWADGAQPARTLAVNVILFCVSPLTPEKLFCVSTEASFFSWRNAPLWPLQRWWVCCRKIGDQRDVSRRNVIRPLVVKLLWDEDRLPCMLAVLRLTGAGFLRCLLAPETSLVNPISEWSQQPISSLSSYLRVLTLVRSSEHLSEQVRRCF